MIVGKPPFFSRHPQQVILSEKDGGLLYGWNMTRKEKYILAPFRPAEWHKKVYRKVRTMTREEQEKWRELRAAVLERDNFACYRCEKRNKAGKGLSVHHLLPRAEGGEDEMSNLVTLCHPCHDIVEVENYRTLAEILASADNKVDPVVEKPLLDREETFPRPAWHKRVYGGVRGG